MGKQGKQWQTFIFLGSKITADGDCSHEIKRCLHLGRKVMTNLDSILKSRDITLPTKVRLVKATMVFPVVMYGCERWTIKKAECQRIDAFELWCQRRLLSIPWTARRSNQSILGFCFRGNQLWIFIRSPDVPILWPSNGKSRLTGKDPDAGIEKGMIEDEMAGGHHGLRGHEFKELWDMVKDRGAWCAAVHGFEKSDTS